MSEAWSGPGKALEEHLRLFKNIERANRYIQENKGQQYWDIYRMPSTIRHRASLMSLTARGIQALDSDGQTIADDPHGAAVNEMTVGKALRLLESEYKIVNEGVTHYVSARIVNDVTAAAEYSFAEPLFETDLLDPIGLMILEKPLLLRDLHPDSGEVVDVKMPIRMIGWRISEEVHVRGEGGKILPRPGISYVLYTDCESFRGDYAESVRESVSAEYADEMIELADELRPELGHVWAVDSSAWAFGMPWSAGADDRPRDQYDIGEVHSNVAYVRRWLLSYFRWTWQRILVPQSYKPTKPERRRLLRAKRPEDGHVKIIRLRREVEREQRGEPRDADDPYYTHRWIVKKHPRRQWYPSLGPARNEDGSFNQESHRMIWIEPYEKGNPFGPLVLGHNVVASVR